MAISNGLKIAVKYLVQFAIDDHIGMTITASKRMASCGKFVFIVRLFKIVKFFYAPTPGQEY